jgi:16S rRNA (cytosine967-C5)-methyltransferase
VIWLVSLLSNQANIPNSRFIALKICLNVIEHGRSLSQVLGEGLAKCDDKRQRAFIQNLVLGTLRWQLRLEAIRGLLVKKPLKAKDEDINQLVLLGLYQILYMDTAEHAAVSETVALTKKLNKIWAKGLVNGILRNFLREQQNILAKVDIKPAHKYSHPQWFIKAMRINYPQKWQDILIANNLPAPIILRTNKMFQSRDELLSLLIEQKIAATAHMYCPEGIQLAKSTDISKLPTFEVGGFSVQDAAAQQAAKILQPQENELILDACAAPGGKICHLLEYSNNKAKLFALEKDPSRIERLSANLDRLCLTAEVKIGDASSSADWWNSKQFDKILLDAPCSATGIIRRHPDIKWHRTEKDINSLVELQATILNALWATLKIGGKLLYATCSVLPAENSEQLKIFIDKTIDAREIPLQVGWGIKPKNNIGRQILPGKQNDNISSNMDGFYYCLLEKI